MISLSNLSLQCGYLALPESFFSRVLPTPLNQPQLVSLNDPLARELGLDPAAIDPKELAELGAGQWLPDGVRPLAQKYTGHQFGFYNPELGDGRGLLLWDSLDPQGRRWEWHLKGAGRTPYSRFGDGRAVLRSTIREYLASEALHYLGIPSTRALFITAAADRVMREREETAATLMRLSPTHLRFGHFEFAAYHLGVEALERLADHAINSCYPELEEVERPERYGRLLEEIIRRTGWMVAQWQSVGFAHGVMNTDNMSILGETFDYGPYGFMDDFEAGFICNHSDTEGRYAFNRQPEIGFWNCQALARAMRPLMDDDRVRQALQVYESAYNGRFLELMGRKLGLTQATREDLPLIMDLFRLLQANRVDYTVFFRTLAEDSRPVRDQFVDREGFDRWEARYRQRLAQQRLPGGRRRSLMLASNPKYILRNYLAQRAIDRAQEGDFSEVDRLLALLRHPFDEQPGSERYAEPPPDWGKHLAVSCSS